eukprot:TRINITY_DN4782_c0_g1_i1.p1 TRINITY_DN4782_c0_g1~~TRINITY_DN4782_c0_g1_i1.p1  ORF type:complete len:770 (+),score=55.11 TRINITY_DN4782_c0_g1_i1:95-2404(+)
MIFRTTLTQHPRQSMKILALLVTILHIDVGHCQDDVCKDLIEVCDLSSTDSCGEGFVCARISEQSEAADCVSDVDEQGICAIPPASGVLLPDSNPVPIAYFPLSDETISSWPFDDYQGTAFGARRVQDSQFSYAFFCQEDEEDYIVLDTVPYADNGSFAINLWFKTTSTDGYIYQYIFSHSLFDFVDDSASEKVWILLPEKQHQAQGIIRTVVHDSNDDATLVYLDSDNQISNNEYRPVVDYEVDDGEWHMYTLTTHIDSTPGYSVYIDGFLAADHGIYNSGPDGQVNGGDPIYLDSDIHLCGTTGNNPDRYFNGLVYQLSLYDQTLTAQNIQALYEIVKQTARSSDDSSIPSDLDRSQCQFPFIYDGRIYSDCFLINGTYMCESMYDYELVECGRVLTSNQPCNTVSSSGCTGEEVCGKLSPESTAVRYLTQLEHDGICTQPPISGVLLPEGNPTPIAYFPLSDSLSSWPYEEYAGESYGDFQSDSLFGQVFDCETYKNTFVKLSSVPYAKNGVFTINMWIKVRMDKFYDSYQYLYVHEDTEGYDSIRIGIYFQRLRRDQIGFIPAIIQDLSSDTLEAEDLADLGDAWILGKDKASEENWHMITISTRKDLSPGYLIYVDGMIVADRSDNNTDSEDYVFDGNPIELDGAMFLCASPELESSNSFQGKIAQLSLYNTVLGEEEVRALYKVVKPDADFLELPTSVSTPINLDCRPCNFPFIFDGQIYNDCMLLNNTYRCMSYTDQWIECKEIISCITKGAKPLKCRRQNT